MLRTNLWAAAASLLIATGAAAADKDKSSLSAGDARFLQKAAADSLAEADLGRLAQERGLHDEVKQFARRMVDDHERANRELQALAAAKGLTLPGAPDDKHRKEADKLRERLGPDFDRAYMKRMVEEHEHDVKEFRKMAKDARDADVKAFAAKTLPTLETHLKEARVTRDVSQGSARTGDRETGSKKP